MAALVDLTDRPALTRNSRYVSGGVAIASVLFLIHDLSRPKRFLHVLRVIKPTSPLSIGSYISAPFSAPPARRVSRSPRTGTSRPSPADPARVPGSCGCARPLAC
jgi:hypothetical protein